jgi:tRNA dimethylallyltransferase
MIKRRAILIAGPTASGKSALALEKAKACGGFIINTDSMQVYDVLRVLTARPPDEDLAIVDHHLYGHVHPSRNYSVAQWVGDVEQLLARDDLLARVPVFVGGTGLYFKALTGGLSNMPDVPDAVRQKWRNLLGEVGAQALHDMLVQSDPKSGERIKPKDGQRIVRALEILEASGQTISHWQSIGSEPLIDVGASEHLCVLPERSLIDVRVINRLHKMVEEGALDEVSQLLTLGLDPSLPAMKAIGVPEFADHISGKTDLETALRLANFATRQYVKRQTTWLRHQLGPHWQYC